MPALNCMHDDQSNNVLWVPTLRWRTGGCWRGAGPWQAACLAAPASNALLVINAGIAAEPGDSQGIGMLYTIPYSVAYKGHCSQKLGSGQTQASSNHHHHQSFINNHSFIPESFCPAFIREKGLQCHLREVPVLVIKRGLQHWGDTGLEIFLVL